MKVRKSNSPKTGDFVTVGDKKLLVVDNSTFDQAIREWMNNKIEGVIISDVRVMHRMFFSDTNPSGILNDPNSKRR